MSKIPVKPIPQDQLTMWELHLLEEECGIVLAEYAGGKPAPIKLALGMLWLAARRTGVKDITLEEATNNFEFAAPDEDADDPKGETPDDPDTSKASG